MGRVESAYSTARSVVGCGRREAATAFSLPGEAVIVIPTKVGTSEAGIFPHAIMNSANTGYTANTSYAANTLEFAGLVENVAIRGNDTPIRE